MFENIDNSILLTPEAIRAEFKDNNDILDNEYKGFIYWFNKQVDKAMVRFKQGKDKNKLKNHVNHIDTADVPLYIKNELKNHIIRIDKINVPQYIRKLLSNFNTDFGDIDKFTDNEIKAVAREVAWVEQFLKANDWQYLGFGDMCVASDSDYKYTFHWRKFNASAKNSSYNPYNEANKTMKIIKGSALEKYDTPDIKSFISFFNKLAIKQLNDGASLTNNMNREIYLYSKDMPAKFRYTRKEKNSYKWYKICQPYLDYLSNNGWKIDYNDYASEYMPSNAEYTYYKFIF